MKLVTWNVNSVRARLPRLLALLERHRPDLVCLQETKALETSFPSQELAAAGYQSEILGQKTYNGVALLTRRPLADVARGFDNDPLPGEARVIAGSQGGLRVVNLYVVNGQAVGTDKYQMKLKWLDALSTWIAERHDPAAPLLLAGDFNIAPDDRDVYAPDLWRGRVLCSAPERERLRRLLDWGLVDLLRRQTQEGGIFTWWDYRHGAFARDWGLRLDLVLATAPVAARLQSITVDRDERRKRGEQTPPSDHAPVVVVLD